VIGEVMHCDWRQLAERVKAEVGMVDALIVDAPYGDVTHKGHDKQAASVNATTGSKRRSLDYRPWDKHDVKEFVAVWSPLVRGWIVSITDDGLATHWRRALGALGRCDFAPLPLTETGATVRLAGDGPSSWTTWVCVARPRTKEMAAWGTLPGAYIVPSERKPVVGGKPLSAMEALVRDYTRPGDLVCDPCCGGGTTLVAAKLLGRRFIGGDLDDKHVELARKRVSAITMGRPLSLNFGDVG
jgi:site-specific DNA-methyltransferase (adenine-specific)